MPFPTPPTVTPPEWTDGHASKQVEPSSGKKALGWVSAEKPPFQWMNWILYSLSQWVAHAFACFASLEDGTADLDVNSMSTGTLETNNVSNAEFDYLDGVRSAIQAQLDLIPFKTPDFSSLTSDTLHVPASSAYPARVRIAGIVYTNTSNRVADITASGRNGLDTGTVTADTLYYLYAIPPTSGTTFDLVISASPPSTGPSGFAEGKYIGSFRAGSSGDIRAFTYCNGVIIFDVTNVAFEVSGAGTSLQEKTLLVPLTARSVYLRAGFITGINAIGDGILSGARSVGGQKTVCRTFTTTIASSPFVLYWEALETPQKIWVSTSHAGTTGAYRVLGWSESPELLP